jgi:hypothetical protein
MTPRTKAPRTKALVLGLAVVAAAVTMVTIVAPSDPAVAGFGTSPGGRGR